MQFFYKIKYFLQIISVLYIIKNDGFSPLVTDKGNIMQKYFVKQGISVAICITMALSLCTYTAAGTLSEAGIAITAELSARAQSLENGAAEKLNTAKSAVKGFFTTAFAPFNLLKAEVTQAIIPEP